MPTVYCAHIHGNEHPDLDKFFIASSAKLLRRDIAEQIRTELWQAEGCEGLPGDDEDDLITEFLYQIQCRIDYSGPVEVRTAYPALAYTVNLYGHEAIDIYHCYLGQSWEDAKECPHWFTTEEGGELETNETRFSYQAFDVRHFTKYAPKNSDIEDILRHAVFSHLIPQERPKRDFRAEYGESKFDQDRDDGLY